MEHYFIHDLDPIIFTIGPIAIRWYSLAYIGGFLLGHRAAIYLVRLQNHPVKEEHLEKILIWIVLSVIIGGRLGHVLFYYPDYYFAKPLDIFKIWEGGMSFHGAVVSVIVGMLLFTRAHKIPFLAMADIVACVAPIGLLLGRIANFINGELWGKPSDVWWAVVFPRVDSQPRHPSQLYEAGLEGALLFALLWLLALKKQTLHQYGRISGFFLLSYGVMRIISEIWREQEVLVNQLPFATSWGQWLSLPMVIVGIWCIKRSYR